jgi:leucyl-tRNA synthetase
MEYRFRDIERKWQAAWQARGAYRVTNDPSRPKCYVLDMFPYPSGAGLHVGHPLGYIASDIYSRFKRLKGFNVLHPMGFDSFGLPAEQYAIEHGIPPAVSTDRNIANFRAQLDRIGFCYDWTREVRTSDASYYRWTQWIFLQLFDSWYDRRSRRARRIAELVDILGAAGNGQHPCPGDPALRLTAADWAALGEKEREEVLMHYRLAYCGHGEVNWCEALGCVLANDEVVNGVSERGGHPVVRRRLRQWYLRITEYADRLLEGLATVDFSESMKEMQANWIGRSQGAEVEFEVRTGDAPPDPARRIRVYTTRPDTLFGVDFMVLAPEHELVPSLITEGQRAEAEAYLAWVAGRSERERMAEKRVTGAFTGSHCIHPFTGRPIPVWVSEYVLAGYGTGAIMGVPCGDERDHRFATQFGLPITNIIGEAYDGTQANPTKDAVLVNSGFLDGLVMRDAIDRAIDRIEADGIGHRRVNYRMRDAAYSRQRYWGEPFPIVWQDGIARPLPEDELPLLLPPLEDLKPGPGGEGPLANLPEWKQTPDGLREVNTMPGFAGSSWYFLRYMDPGNETEFCARTASDYWGQVDLYIGGTEHAVGHLLYSRMWTKALFDLGLIGFDEPFKRLVNQGKIGGDSRIAYRIRGTNRFVSAGLRDAYETDEIHVDVSMVDGVELDTEAFRRWRPDLHDATFACEDGKYHCGTRLEKMSKRYHNVVNPDDVVERYGADTFRMYEMFLGPVEQDKPWDTKGIEGVHRFLKKTWRLFMDETKGCIVTDGEPSDAEWKALYRMVRRIGEDTERFSFNTAVSGFMIGVNELTDLGCHKRQVLEKLLITLSPYAPHLCEELWQATGHADSILDQPFPTVEEHYLVETTKAYPVAVNGKTRSELTLPLDADQQAVEAAVMADPVVQRWLDGKPPKKIIHVPNRMINVVV